MTKSRRRVVRRLGIVAIVMALIVAGYVSYVAVRHVRPVALPVASGPYLVGRSRVEWTDPARVDPLAPTAGEPRRLAVWLWYPAVAGGDMRPAPYTPGPWVQLHLAAPVGWAESDFTAIRTGAYEYAPVAPGRFPIVVLEPGMGFSAPQYSVLAESLAGHGFMVAAVTPTYSANLTVLGGRIVGAEKAGNPPQLGSHSGEPGAQADRLVGIWAADAHFVAAEVAALDRGGALAGHIDATRVAYIGHSFGGAAALEACRSDPACAGAVDMDGTQFGPVARKGLHSPTLVLGHENSCVTGGCTPSGPDDRDDLAVAQSLIAASSGPVWAFTIDGTAHFDFTDYAAYYLATPLRRFLALGSLDGRRALTITSSLVTTFLDQAMLGHKSAALNTSKSPYPEVRVTHLPR
ncbi:hypothetical protein AB0C29_03155 [Actinoplanes sp. NPDC048791]|uniref:alpha/beta hydrolase family protein n=1 Tax=Actinoplanes sp. NPDC048791 TaxID=3154623 RepID=UPI0033C1EB7D